MNRSILKKFIRGAVVIERGLAHTNNPGHVAGFELQGDEVLIKVDFANGDRFCLAPQDLDVL